MATAVIMPRQGQSVESCIISAWNKKVGDKVNIGDILFSYETDKASFEEESKIEGTMLAILFEEGDDVPCLTNVCVIGGEGEDISAFKTAQAAPETKEEAKKEEAAPAETVAAPALAVAPAAQSAIVAEGKFISPRARNLAERANVDYRYAAATGPGGRIIERDVNALIDSGVKFTSAAKSEYLQGEGNLEGTGIGGRISVDDLGRKIENNMIPVVDTGADYEEVKLSTVRKSIAKAMHTSLSTMAQLTLNSSFDATKIMEYRKSVKENRERLGLNDITLNDIILYAVSRTVLEHKECNAHYFDDKMHLFNNVHLGVAVDTVKGLLVPTIFNSNKKSLNDISAEMKELAKLAQQGNISPDYLKGGTITVTNLGSLGVESFTPVINPPQTCILGVDNTAIRIKQVKGEYIHYTAMGLSLTFDHRAIDGAPAAKFLKALVNNLENFDMLLAR